MIVVPHFSSQPPSACLQRRHSLVAMLLSTVDMRQHAMDLRDRGFTVIRDAGCISAPLVEAAGEDCRVVLNELLEQAAAIGCDPVEQVYAFNEICNRNRNRWDMRMPQTTAFDALLEETETVASAVLRTLRQLPLHRDEPGLRLTRLITPRRPKTCQTGAIVSRHGASGQFFHQDGHSNSWAMRTLPGHRLFNIFVPLVDVPANGDGTAFIPGSHLWTRERLLRERDESALPLEESDRAEAPSCPAGGLILFDYRVLHRGLPNAQGRTRPVAYATMGLGWARDTVNFPDISLRAVVDKLPTDHEEREGSRRAIRRATPFYDDTSLTDTEMEELPAA